MKVLHINSYYNGSKFYKNMYDKQINKGLDISVFVPVVANSNNIEEFGEYSVISANHSKLDRCIFYLKHKKILKDVNNKYDVEKYSLIHAHSLFSNGYIAMKLNKKYGIPYIVAVRNTDVNMFFKKMIHLRKTGLEILNNASRIIFLSKSYKNEVLDKYVPKSMKTKLAEKMIIIPNGIDDFWFKNIVDQKQGRLDTDIKLLQVGDINKNKNIETTIKAIKLLIKKNFKVKLNVVGKIKEQRVFNAIKGFEYVNYLSTKNKEELLEIYRENDIFIMPSINETFGLVYVEAMSQGLPIIYSRGQGFDGQFEDGKVGYSVESMDCEDIADKIGKIMSNYGEIRKNCLLMSKNFDWEDIVGEYKDIYTDILDERVNDNGI